MKIYTLHCTGRGIFPLDMLRYAQGWPVNTSDVDLMNPANRERRTIAVDICVSSPAFVDNIVRRFKSFGWRAEVQHE